VINPLKNPNNINALHSMDRVEIVFYTDPLCCWSWAMLPELEKLKASFGDLMNITYCMGGLIKDWNSFADPLNNVSKPSQMGPVWMDASRQTGLAINDTLWATDPPSSSYPACIAVKTAALQSPEAEAAYFKQLAAAAMVDGKNTAKPVVLVQVAEQLAKELPHVFNLPDFLRDYNNESSRNAFRDDLQRVRANHIGRFPTLTLAYQQKKILMTGYRTYDILLDALTNIAPSLVPEHSR
jgi:putative protein-disulfide isomerase